MATATARRGVKLAATLTVVVLALTGFQTSSSGGKSGSGKSGKSGKSRSSDSDGGGGCSSSKKQNDDYDDHDSSGGGGSGSDYTTEPATPSVSPSSDVEVEVVDCVKPAQRKRAGKPARKADTTATLRITSRRSFTETYRVTLEFKDASNGLVDSKDELVTVGPGESKVFDVKMDSPRLVDKVRKCAVYDVRRTDASATPTASGSPSPSS
ncbi:hypothetical protein [Streptomyces vilmorinianum]|uniref:hypothetical protein n=1 Tax=Streptomyces vilmorinianum TaxID=3051092 RepID=UPI0010FB757C|nr:hypothetical protein [Streptomyces vilmorinianum]